MGHASLRGGPVRESKPSSKQPFILIWLVIALACVPFLTPGSLSFAQDCSNRQASATNFDSVAYKSTDGGASWKTVVDVNTDFLAHQANRIVIDPFDASIVYVGTNNGVFKSANGGCSWRNSSDGITERYVRDWIIDPKTTSNLYALAAKNSGNIYRVPVSNKVFITVDGGNVWKAVSFDYNITCLAIDPANPSTLYLGASNQDVLGIYKSTDNGKTFSFIKQRDNTSGLSIAYIVVDPKNPSTLYYGSNMSGVRNTLGGLYKSTDGGITFEIIRHPDDSTFTFSLVIDPRDPPTLYEASSGGLFKSTDGGSNWVSILHNGYPLAAESLAIDAANSIYASVDLPVGSLYPLHNLLKSTDAGQTWTSVTFKPSASSLAFDPANPSVIYDVGFVPPPVIGSISISGKKVVVGANFIHDGAVIRIEGERQKTQLRTGANGFPSVELVSRKGAKGIAPGQVVSVSIEEADGVEVSGFGYRPN
jgi:photosystem II stability/assembly factor-like uncharacterized protein